MILGTKCGFNQEQLLCSTKKGLKFLEFHTNYNDFYDDIDFKKIKSILKKQDVTCHAIHAPIADANGNIESISIGTFDSKNRKENIELFKKCIKLADYLCDTPNPIVVTHIGTGYHLNDATKNHYSEKEINVFLKEAEEDLKELNQYILENYPNTTIVVENMPPLCFDEKNNSIVSWYFGHRDDLPNFIENLNISNVKTCLDICHLMTTLRLDNATNPYDAKNLEYYMECYSKSLGLIHLNNCIYLGETKNNHSQPFSYNSKEDIELLTTFFNCIERYNINCPITLEINENDYLIQDNVEKTIDCIKNIIKI